MTTRCYRCLDDGVVRHADGEGICDCPAGQAHAAGIEADAARKQCPHCDEQHKPGECRFRINGVECDWIQLAGD